MRTLLYSALLAAVVACGGDADTSGPPDVAEDPDPLTSIVPASEPGSLDDLHERIISQRCSGEPGLCHNGQFEPNLSTPALTYAYLVNRPGIEVSSRLRVKPGDSSASLFIDKIRNRNGVATQMPLGAEPLDEAEIAEIEAWIDSGALRTPGADPAPVLNNPPRRPEIGIFRGTQRLDGTGPVEANAGETLILRHTVNDFETADDNIPFSAVILGLGDGNNVVLTAAQNDPHVAPTVIDNAGPQGKGDVLNRRFDWTIPTTLSVRDDAGTITTRAASGQTVTVLAVYFDVAPPGGIVAIDFSATPIEIQ